MTHFETLLLGSKRDQVSDQVRYPVYDQVDDQAWVQVDDQVCDRVYDQVGDQVWLQIREDLQ